MTAIPHGPPNAARVRYIHEHYYCDLRLYSDTPRDEWWMIGKLFYRENGVEVPYDSDGIEVGSVVPTGYREWLRTCRAD